MAAEPISFFSAFLIGLMGGAHCVGMCGGIMGALTIAVPANQRSALRITPILLSYNAGRIASYTLAGAIVGTFGWWLAGQHHLLTPLLRWAAGLMLIAMGLYMGSWWNGLVKVEAMGRYLWRYLQPIGQRLLPVTSASQALCLGMIWGWLPCGLVYSALVWSASAISISDAALIMTSFGLGTLPAVLATGYLARQIVAIQRSRPVRTLSGLLLIAYGFWTIPIWSHLGNLATAHSH